MKILIIFAEKILESVEISYVFFILLFMIES